MARSFLGGEFAGGESARACSVNGSLASLISKAHLKLIALTLTLMRGQKRQLYEFFVELVFLNLRSF